MNALMMLGGVLPTAAADGLSRSVARRYPSPFTSPVFFSTALIVLVLMAGATPFSSDQAAQDILVTLPSPPPWRWNWRPSSRAT